MTMSDNLILISRLPGTSQSVSYLHDDGVCLDDHVVDVPTSSGLDGATLGTDRDPQWKIFYENLSDFICYLRVISAWRLPSSKQA